MLEQLMKQYLVRLDEVMRQIVATAPLATPNYGVMLSYPLGWVDANNQPMYHPAGKRIRPILLMLCCEAAGENWETALPAAAAVELLHNFSLIHDDIQDDSPLRHGRATVWKVWGANNAINAGDAMFALSHTALSYLSETGVSAEIALECWRIFNATTVELTRGQHLDMRFEHQPKVTVDDYLSMISGKTAALLACCAQLGALIATGNPELAAHYHSFGLNIGIAFQIHDDMLGIWGKPDVTGKSAATDIISKKKSLPVLYGLTLSEELRELYQKPEFDNIDVTRAVTILESIGTLEYMQQQESKFYNRAMEAINAAHPQGEAAEALAALVDMLFQRLN